MIRSGGSHWKSDAGLLFAVFVWGINIPILKAALAAMPIHALNAFRFVISALVLGAVYYVRQKRQAGTFFEPLRRHGRQIAGLGLLGYVLYQLCFIIGIDHTTAGNAALIMAGAPLWTAVISHRARYDYLSGTAWFGLLITLLGTIIVVVAGSEEITLSSGTFLGNVLMLVASVLWGSYTAFARPVLRDITPSGLTFLGLLFALPFLFGIALPYLDQIRWEEVDLWVWLAIVFSGGLSTGLTVVIWNNAVQTVGPSQTAAFGNLVPLIALVFSAVLLGESILLAQIAGGALIIGGLLFMRRARRSTTPA